MQLSRKMKLFSSLLTGFVLVFCASLALGQQGASSSAPPPAPAKTDAPGQSAAPKAQESTPAITANGTPLYKTIVEDWSSLAVGKSELHPEPPLSLGPEEHDKFTRELIQVKWRPGDPLDLYVIKPVIKPLMAPKLPAILYLYGYPSTTDRFKNDGWCERVTGGGFVAIGFVSALTGERFHDRPLKQWFVSELQESLGSSVHDVKFILDYLASRGDIDMDRIGMFGGGSGGSIAIMAAAADPRIKTLDLLDPWGDWPEWLANSPVLAEDPDRDGYVKAAFLDKVAPLDPVKWFPELKTQRIRLQQTLDDPDTTKESREKIANAAPASVEVEKFENSSRLFKAEGGGVIFEWSKDQLRQMTPKQQTAQTPKMTGVSAK